MKKTILFLLIFAVSVPAYALYELAGIWSGGAEIIKSAGEEKSFDLEITILQSNKVKGTIGGARIESADIFRANAWEKLIYDSSYIIKGAISGNIFEGINNTKNFIIVFDLNDSLMHGKFLGLGKFYLLTKIKAEINVQKPGTIIPGITEERNF